MLKVIRVSAEVLFSALSVLTVLPGCKSNKPGDAVGYSPPGYLGIQPGTTPNGNAKTYGQPINPGGMQGLGTRV
ncbi:MAG: hypothetical protein VXZ82_07930 [Planctomycetota bacterium]|nr:hypothetical protein [Planctomycetota bacterium]